MAGAHGERRASAPGSRGPSDWLGHVVFSEAAIAMDRRRSGFPCRVDLGCTFIGASREVVIGHERTAHETPTSPLATPRAVPLIEVRLLEGARPRRSQS